MHAAGPCALTLYLLEYGDGYFAENPDAQLALVDFVRGNRTPVPQVSVSGEVNGLAPFEVEFSSAGTTDAYGDRLAYAWDSDADGVVDSRVQNPTFTYEENGVYEATLKVPDQTGPGRTGRSAAASVRITVGNTAPVVEFVTPVDGRTSPSSTGWPSRSRSPTTRRSTARGSR